MPVSPMPSCSFWITERTACPPEAQAFSTLSMGLPAMPGVSAIRPAIKPCSLREKLQAAATLPTSNAAGSAPICRQAPWMAASRICGTVMPISLPNFDW